MTAARSVGLGLALVFTAGLGWWSQMPYEGAGSDGALLRFSWRAPGQRLEQCREPTEEELEGLPDHMRPQQICERAMRPFDLRIEVDDSVVVDAVVRAPGAQGDRPISVLRDVPTFAGPHRVRVAFGPTASAPSDAQTERPVRLDRTVDLGAGDIAVITLDESGRAFRVLTGAG